MNARAEMPEPDFELIIGMLASPHMHGRSRFDEQGERLRAWLAAQPLAPEGGDDRPASMYGLVNATPPAPAREAVAWQYRVRFGGKSAPWEPWRDIDVITWLSGSQTPHDNIQYRRLFDEAPAAGAVVVDEAAVSRLADFIEDRPAYICLPDDERRRIAREYLTAAIGSKP